MRERVGEREREGGGVKLGLAEAKLLADATVINGS